MKIRLSQIIATSAAGRRERAFTLAEVIITTGVFLLLMVGVIYGYIFGIKLFQITKVKLGVTDDARKAFIRLTDEIRSANQILIGSGNLTNFVGDGTNALQSGYALKIYPDTDHVNNWIRYWYDTNTADAANFGRLLRTTDGINFTQVMPDAVSTNLAIFTSENCDGTTVTNNFNNRIIGVTLQFRQYTPVRVGTNNYDFYQLHSRITRRVF